MINPLFSNDHDEKEEKKRGDSYLVGKRHSGRIEPIHKDVRPEPRVYNPPEKPAPKPEPKAVVHEHEPARPQTDLKPEAVLLPPEKRSATVVKPEKAAQTAGATAASQKTDNPAVELIRRKLDALYQTEPKAKEEIAELAHTPGRRSKHQQYMQELSTSGKSLAEIQTAWHQYYVALPDNEKHEVWQEFYEANARRPSQYSQFVEQHAGNTKGTFETESAQTSEIEPVPEHAKKLEPEAKAAIFEKTPPSLPHRDRRSARTIKRNILSKVSAEKQEKAKQHLKSLIFGISTGVIVLVVFLFSFFNEVVIAPFIQPSRKAAATPIILNSDGVAPTDKNEVIIPKINVQIPLDFSVTTTDEGAIENALDSGVVHYPTTVAPGQRGNTAYFGHSSNNIFNPGKYKFAFVLLHALENGDIFYITYNGKVYSYKVFQKQIVNPSNVSVLNPVADKVATATLITCDPPGTSINRLVVWGEQVSPDPAGNTAGTPTTTNSNAKALPSNGPTLWGRFIKWLTS